MILTIDSNLTPYLVENNGWLQWQTVIFPFNQLTSYFSTDAILIPAKISMTPAERLINLITAGLIPILIDLNPKYP